jgi:hypothetical protein
MHMRPRPHVNGASHDVPQHGCPLPPHATQTLLLPQTENGPGQPMPLQQVWPVEPHAPPPQLPPLQVPVPMPQSMPVPTHWSFTQHAPPPHA